MSTPSAITILVTTAIDFCSIPDTSLTRDLVHIYCTAQKAPVHNYN